MTWRESFADVSWSVRESSGATFTMVAADYAASLKEPIVKQPRRLVILPVIFLASVGFAACGDDAVQQPADSEVMTESTDAVMTPSRRTR